MDERQLCDIFNTYKKGHKGVKCLSIIDNIGYRVAGVNDAHVNAWELKMHWDYFCAANAQKIREGLERLVLEDSEKSHKKNVHFLQQKSGKAYFLR